jgi:long-chain fatty acid transport protein
MRRPVSTLFLLLSGLNGSVWAQTNDDINSGVQFNFSTPGARSLAMGGAFLALADDATAAYTNPAGLSNLTTGGSEVSLEIRQGRFVNAFTDGGHVGGPPTGIGIDTSDGLVRSDSESDASGLSFLSVGYVLPRGWTVAVYRHELANFQSAIESQGPMVGSGARLNGPTGKRDLSRIRPARSVLNLDIVNNGISGAYEFANAVSIGVGVSYYEFSLDSRTERFFHSEQDFDGDGVVGEADDRANRQLGGFLGPADMLGDNVYNIQTQQGDDEDWGVNIGLLWRVSRRWSLGAAYRQGPDFEVQARYVYGPKGRQPGQSASPNLCSPSRTQDCIGGEGVFHVPDNLGIGVAWSTPSGMTKLTLDYDRVFYSQLTDDLINILVRDVEDFNRAYYRLDDAGEIHLGFENILGIGAQLVATLRLGAWYDPAHVIEYTGSDQVLLARFRPGEDEIHGAVGVGLVVKENLQVDVAIDVSDRTRIGSISLVKFF